ncbi:Siderophore transporter fer7 [Thecaphora frezii]
MDTRYPSHSSSRLSDVEQASLDRKAPSQTSYDLHHDQGYDPHSSSPHRLLGFRDADPSSVHRIQQPGVSRVEALYRVLPRNGALVWSLYFSLAAVTLCFSLDSSTTAAYQLFGASHFGQHGKLFGIIATAESILNAVSKPLLAKLCDVFSRQTAYLCVLVFYTLGYVVLATAPNPGAFATGRILTEVGQAGFDLITDIIVADLSPLQWRGVVTALTSSPYIVLPWIGNLLQARINRDRENGWRWGYGMFAIIAPVCVLPVVLILSYADRKAVRAGELSFASSRLETRAAVEASTIKVQRASLAERGRLLLRLLDEMDLVGLVLLATAFALILLPFNLRGDAKGGWSNPSMVAMLVCGAVVLVLFATWEARFASHPVMNRRVWCNRTFVLAATIDIFYFMGGSLRSTYYGSYVYIATDLSLVEWGYAVNALSTCALSVFGLAAGVYLRVFHRYKWLQVFGLCVRLVALGLTYWATGGRATTVAVVWCQVLNSLGGACSVVGTRVASQASVAHQDLASTVAQLALWTRLGGAIGSAVAASLWTGNVRRHLEEEGMSASTVDRIYGQPTVAKWLYAWGTRERQLVVGAFEATVRPMFLAALCVTVVPLLAGLLMRDYYLGLTQNAVDGTDNRGEVIEPPQARLPARMRGVGTASE